MLILQFWNQLESFCSGSSDWLKTSLDRALLHLHSLQLERRRSEVADRDVSGSFLLRFFRQPALCHSIIFGDGGGSRKRPLQTSIVGPFENDKLLFLVTVPEPRWPQKQP